MIVYRLSAGRETMAHILLVEDDEDQAQLFTQVLEMAGNAVTTAGTADDALATLPSAPFALLLADWDLPDTKGDTLIAAVRGSYPTLRTVLYSNHAHVDEAAQACGADAWVRKSEGIQRLRQVIGGLLAPQVST
jgi:DNA-binding NtrC family response regulator